jgi:hypothetical protein
MDAEFISQQRTGPGPSWAMWRSVRDPQNSRAAAAIAEHASAMQALASASPDVMAECKNVFDAEGPRALAFRAQRPADGFVVIAYTNNVAVLYSVDPSTVTEAVRGFSCSGQAYASGPGVPEMLKVFEDAGRTVIRIQAERAVLTGAVPGSKEFDAEAVLHEMKLIRDLILIESGEGSLDDLSRPGFNPRQN